MPVGRPLIILQVEDSTADALLTASAMEGGDIPYSLYLIPDGAEAIDFLKRRGSHRDAPRPHVVILDLDVPSLNGNEVLEFIKGDADLMTIPVIIFSGRDTAQSKQYAYEHHANSYVVKPMDLAGFTKKIQSIAEYWGDTSELHHATPTT